MTTFPATLYFRMTTETRPSTLQGAGIGVFALEDVAAGTFLGMDFLTRKWLIDVDAVPELPPERQIFAWRHIESICFSVDSDEKTPMDFLNHSFEPNILWHVGQYFVLRDISIGDELFIDYRHLCDPSWGVYLHDSASGRSVIGWEWREAVEHSSRQLADLMAAARNQSR